MTYYNIPDIHSIRSSTKFSKEISMYKQEIIDDISKSIYYNSLKGLYRVTKSISKQTHQLDVDDLRILINSIGNEFTKCGYDVYIKKHDVLSNTFIIQISWLDEGSNGI